MCSSDLEDGTGERVAGLALVEVGVGAPTQIGIVEPVEHEQRHTHFIDSPRIVDSTSASDFRFADLKERPGTVFLCLPPDRLDAYARWLRLLVSQAVTDMARSPARPDKPVLFLLDEFAALGRLDPVERAMGLMAGYEIGRAHV